MLICCHGYYTLIIELVFANFINNFLIRIMHKVKVNRGKGYTMGGKDYKTGVKVTQWEV